MKRYLIRSAYLTILAEGNTLDDSQRVVETAVLCTFGFSVCWRDENKVLRQRIHKNRDEAEKHVLALGSMRPVQEVTA